MARKPAAKTRGVYEREVGSNIWWIRYTVSGRIKREKVGRKSDATALYQRRKSEIRIGVKLPDNMRNRGVTFAVIGQEAIDWYERHKRRDTRTFTARMKTIISDFGNRVADEIAPQEFDVWLSAHVGWSPATRNRFKAVMSKAYRLALVEGKVSRNPARLVEHRVEHNRRIRYLLAEEEALLRKAIMRRCQTQMPAFVTALHTGMRRSEQFSLEWSNVDFRRKRIYLSKTKNGSDREIPLNKTCTMLLQALYEKRPDDGKVFQSTRYKRPLLDPKKWFTNALLEAKIMNFRWHDLRHTFCSRLVQAGVDIRTVAELAGHKSISMTMRYAHLAPEHNQAAIEKLDAFSV